MLLSSKLAQHPHPCCAAPPPPLPCACPFVCAPQASYTFSLPYVATVQTQGLSFPVTMWVDADSARMRVDVFGGLDSTLTLQVRRAAAWATAHEWSVLRRDSCVGEACWLAAPYTCSMWLHAAAMSRSCLSKQQGMHVACATLCLGWQLHAASMRK